MKMLNKILDILFPTNIKCIFCDEELDGTTSNCTCSNCYSKLPFIISSCSRCGISIPADKPGVCTKCKTQNYNFDRARAVFDYSGLIVNIIHKYKFGEMKYLYEALANFMIDAYALLDFEPSIICAVPISDARMKERGFNQSELLAKAIAKKFNLKYLKLCNKIKDNVSQATLDFKDRTENVKDVYEINKDYTKEIKGKSVLIIDDIFTTGATCNEVSKVIKKAGANKVEVFTLAHTPTPSSTPIS